MVGTPKRPVGKSVTVVQTDGGLKQELDKLKQELLVQLAKILGEVQAAQILGYHTPGNSKELDDMPVFIPEIIGTGKNVEAEINVQTNESQANELDDAAKALREMKQKKKEDNNEQ